MLIGCNLTMQTGETVKQVRWLDRHQRLLLAYLPTVPVRVSHQAPGVQLTASHSDASHSDASHITITTVRPEDEGCYRCVFDVYPRGPLEGTTCIRVNGQSEVKSHGLFPQSTSETSPSVF